MNKAGFDITNEVGQTHAVATFNDSMTASMHAVDGVLSQNVF